MTERKDLSAKLAAAIAYVKALTPAEVDAMLRTQIEGVAKAEASWPKPRYEWVNGVKVYASYEDFCND